MVLVEIITVDVEQQDIDAGKPTDCWQCPIALAMYACTDRQWQVDDEAVYLQSDHGKVGKLPREAKNFIADFDDGKPVSPFSFEVMIHEW